VRLRLLLAAYPPAGRVLHEVIFARALPRVAAGRVRRRDLPGSEALADAIDGIRGKGTDPDEAAWIQRIETRRDEFSELPTMTFDSPATPGQPWRRNGRLLAQVASIRPPWGRFLLRLVRGLRPESCIELGGAIGISAAYQAAGLELNGAGRLLSIEGSPELAGHARQTLTGLGLERVEVVEGRFEEVLEPILPNAAPVDLAYLDAGKGRDQNVALFDQLLPHLSPRAMVVMDDIHWSKEMNLAWRDISSHPSVALSVDLWRLGACLVARL
jgi:predicted O-methyltransferase YrrM